MLCLWLEFSPGFDKSRFADFKHVPFISKNPKKHVKLTIHYHEVISTAGYFSTDDMCHVTQKTKLTSQVNLIKYLQCNSWQVY